LYLAFSLPLFVGKTGSQNDVLHETENVEIPLEHRQDRFNEDQYEERTGLRDEEHWRLEKNHYRDVINDALNGQRCRGHIESLHIRLIKIPMIHKNAKIAAKIAPGIEEVQVIGMLNVGGLDSGTVLVDLLNPAIWRGRVLDVVEIEEQCCSLGCKEKSDKGIEDQLRDGLALCVLKEATDIVIANVAEGEVGN